MTGFAISDFFIWKDLGGILLREGLAQCPKVVCEVGELVMGVESAGVGQHPHGRACQGPRLPSEHREALCKSYPVGADAQNRHDLRLVAFHCCF